MQHFYTTPVSRMNLEEFAPEDIFAPKGLLILMPTPAPMGHTVISWAWQVLQSALIAHQEKYAMV